MAKEMREHNLMNFRAQIEALPGLAWEKTEATQRTKDKNGNVTEDKWEYSYPDFSADHVPQLVAILGNENVAALFTDAAKLTYRNAPTQEKLMQNAIDAMVRAGVPREQAEALLRR